MATPTTMLRQSTPVALFSILLGVLLLVAVASLHIGVMPLSASTLWQTLLHGPADASAEGATIWLIRLPRLILAILIGAALAQSGAAMQGLFRNPMADPSLLGISSGAALAAAFVIVLSGRLFPSALEMGRYLPVACFIGGVITAWTVARIATIQGRTRIATLLLAGLAINALVNAAIGLLSYLADDMALRSLTFWMFGSLGKASWTEIAWAAPLILLPILIIPGSSKALNALLLGEAEAGHLGVSVEAVKRRLMLWIVLAVSTSVSLAGVIGFIGLVTPHLLRIRLGPDHRLLLPASALLGAILLVCADTVARILVMPNEIPIGILTALIGAPFFLILLIRHRGTVEVP